MSSICKNKKCGKRHDGLFGSGRYCSRACANSRIRTEAIKLKTSITAKSSKVKKEAERLRWIRYYETHERKRITRICKICGNEFEVKHKQSVRTTCSYECKCYLLSVRRQEIIQRDGFDTKRELFKYNSIEIYCDSILEKAAIIYLVDFLKVKKVERFRNLLNFWKGDCRKTFNPDFWITFEDGAEGIVEVKMKYYEGYEYEYNATIPYKKQALEDFCNERGYKNIWLTFDYDKRFKTIYNNLLRDRDKKETGVISACSLTDRIGNF